MKHLLSEIDKQIFSSSQLAADYPLTQTARLLGLKEQTVRRSLTKLLDNGIIFVRPLINWSALGLERYYLYFSLSSKGESDTREVLNFLENAPELSFLHATSGEYQYLASLLVPGPNGAMAFMKRLQNCFGYVFEKKSLTNLQRSLFFGRGYLSDTKKIIDCIETKIGMPIRNIDEIDRALLSHIFSNNFLSLAELSRTLKLPHSTVAYRLKRLRDDSVIAGFVYGLPKPLPNTCSTRIFIYPRGSLQFAEKLEEFARSHPNVVAMNSMLGEWDFELAVETLGAEALLKFQSEFLDRFSAMIAKAPSIQTLSTLKSLSVRFESLEICGKAA